MSDPPAEKSKGSSSITMLLARDLEKEGTFTSPVHLIDGFPWRLRVNHLNHLDERGYRYYEVFLICDASAEFELWCCDANIKLTTSCESRGLFRKELFPMFASWKSNEQENKLIDVVMFPTDRTFTVEVEIKMDNDGNSWTRRPILDSHDSVDGVMVIGEKKIEVNKESLTALSPYFDKLFDGDLKENTIRDVGYEEFYNIYRMIYGFNGATISDLNVCRVMELAERFELKIVQDRAISYLLSTSSHLPYQTKLLIVDRYNSPLIKNIILSRCDKKSLKNICEWEELEKLSFETLRVLFNKSCMLKIAEESEESENTLKKGPKLSIIVEEWKDGQVEQFSPIFRINGFPWRLRLYKVGYDHKGLELICENSAEAEVWACTAKGIWIARVHTAQHITIRSMMSTMEDTFTNWNEDKKLDIYPYKAGEKVIVQLWMKGDEISWSPRPPLVQVDSHDGILVFGEEKKEIPVNKESLASQSPFFERLFFGDFVENNLNEIPIGDVEYEEFSNIMNLIYGCDGASMTDENVHTILELVDRFELKIVEDKVISFLLSSSSSLSVPQKLIISDQYNISFLRDYLISCKYNSNWHLLELCESPYWNQLSKGTIRALFKKFSI